MEAISSRNWIAIAVMVIGYLVRLTKNDSAFPVNVPARWRPLVALVLGQAYAVLVTVQGGVKPSDAVVQGLLASVITMGLFDVLVKALWNGSEPNWIKWLVLAESKGSQNVQS